jgi:hypothetical protein
MDVAELLDKLKYIPKDAEVLVNDTYNNNFKRIKSCNDATSLYGRDKEEHFFVIKI